MSVSIDLQIAAEKSNDQVEEFPSEQLCKKTLDTVLTHIGISEEKEITVRIVSADESASLNQQYRNRQGATNVLSFSFEKPVGLPEDVDINLLGDLILCADVIIKEAHTQNKQEMSHWTHLLIHGCLHLMGYDHQNETEAVEMESKEREIMEMLGFTDPYR